MAGFSDLPKTFFLFAAIAFWDALTTIIGTIKALGGPAAGSMILGVLVSIVVVGLIFITFDIWSDGNSVIRDNSFVRWGVRGLWFIAVSYDFYTSLVGNATLLTLNFSDLNGFAVLFFATLLCVGSSLIAAFVYHNNAKPNETKGADSW